MKIRLGDQPGVLINLPSKKPGEGTILSGKASANLQALKCSQNVEFDVSVVQKFRNDLEKMHVTLKGGTSLISRCKTFEAILEMTLVGHVSVQLSMSTSEFRQTRDIQWKASGYFTFEPSKIKKIVQDVVD